MGASVTIVTILLVAQTTAAKAVWLRRGSVALVLLVGAVTFGLLAANIARRMVRRYTDAPSEGRRGPPPRDDWARRPPGRVERELFSDERE